MNKPLSLLGDAASGSTKKDDDDNDDWRRAHLGRSKEVQGRGSSSFGGARFRLQFAIVTALGGPVVPFLDSMAYRGYGLGSEWKVNVTQCNVRMFACMYNTYCVPCHVCHVD